MTPLKRHLPIILGVILLIIITQKAKAFGRDPKLKYLEGYYFDSTGHPIHGYIARAEAEFQFIYYKRKLGDSTQRIMVTRCDSFVVDHRTFYAIKDITIRTRIWTAHLDKAFAEKVADGPVQLFHLNFIQGKVGYMRYVSMAAKFAPGDAAKAVGSVTGKLTTNYFLRPQKGGPCTRLARKKKAFRQQMADYLQDDQPLVQKILHNKDYSMSNIEIIIQEYDSDRGRKQ